MTGTLLPSWREATDVFAPLSACFAPIVRRPLLPDVEMKTQGWRRCLRVVSNRDAHAKSHPSQPVSTKALLVVYRRMTTRIGLPQAGHEATTGEGASLSGALKAMSCRFRIMRRMASGGMAQLAFIKPKCRTFIKPAGRTCWRNLRINSMASRLVVRGLALSGLRYVKVTVRSLSETMRRLEMATLKTEGARYLKDVWPFGLA
jgi:hypothetical protein